MAEKKATKQMTITRFDSALHAEAKIASIRSGVFLTDFIQLAVRHEIDGNHRQPSPDKKARAAATAEGPILSEK